MMPFYEESTDGKSCLATLDLDLFDDYDLELPYNGELDLIVDDLVHNMKECMMIGVILRGGKKVIVLSADRAAARSATAEGKAGLHGLLDRVIESTMAMKGTYESE
ncbi:MAG: hypothetical protein PUK35_04510 [Methanomassiliicoccales archaeon]|nr:hypothetical protein [Methanomassiliicoccales archaeon]MDD7479097.1 hypothetical protein [Methanomassiliicoccales archaeon]